MTHRNVTRVGVRVDIWPNGADRYAFDSEIGVLFLDLDVHEYETDEGGVIQTAVDAWCKKNDYDPAAVFWDVTDAAEI